MHPIHLYHYTSVSVLCNLFTNIRNGQFVFHASSIDYMNDSLEYAVAKTHCLDGVDEMIMELELGIPYALCFSERCDSIPMWNMYAKGGKGVSLRFNFERLNKHFCQLNDNDERVIKFDKCSYQDISPQNDNKPLDSQAQYPDIKDVGKKMTEDAFIKPNCFSHENEWRVIIWQKWTPNEKHKLFFKEKQDELCPYIELPVAVNCLEGIILAPGASEQMQEATKLLRTHYGDNGISVETSVISLKV